MQENKKIQEITASAFIYKDSRLFIAKRSRMKKFLPNKYELPGGHIEFGETMEEGLEREIKEEFSMKVAVEEPFYAFTYTRKKGTIHVVEVDYFARFVDPEEKIKLNPVDHSKYRWITIHEVSSFFEENDEEYKAIKRGFELLKNKAIFK